MNAADRFFAKVRPTANGCLEWTGAAHALGYGHFYADGKMHRAHRWLWERLIVVPAGMDADHLCRNPRCVRPSHIQFVTRSENVRRGALGAVSRARAARVTHCPQGHAYDEANTYVYRLKSGYLSRRCKTCSKARSKTEAGRARAAAWQRAYRARLKRRVVVYADSTELGAVDEASAKALEVYKRVRADLAVA